MVMNAEDYVLVRHQIQLENVELESLFVDTSDSIPSLTELGEEKDVEVSSNISTGMGNIVKDGKFSYIKGFVGYLLRYLLPNQDIVLCIKVKVSGRFYRNDSNATLSDEDFAVATEKILVPLLLPHIKAYTIMLSSITKIAIPIPTIDIVHTINRNCPDEEAPSVKSTVAKSPIVIGTNVKNTFKADIVFGRYEGSMEFCKSVFVPKGSIYTYGDDDTLSFDINTIGSDTIESEYNCHIEECEAPFASPFMGDRRFKLSLVSDVYGSNTFELWGSEINRLVTRVSLLDSSESVVTE